MEIDKIRTLKIIFGDKNISDITIKDFLKEVKVNFTLIKFFKIKKNFISKKK